MSGGKAEGKGGNRLPYFYAKRSGERVTIEGEDARHLVRSLRKRAGDTISVVDPAGLLLTVRLLQVSAGSVTGDVLEEQEHHPEPERSITLAVAMLPASSLDLVLSRCTEAGAARFQLVAAERSVARGGRPDRWQTICREAAMLAGRLQVPEVRAPVGLEEAWTQAPEPYLLDRSGSPMRGLESGAALFIGPEGGWTPAELAMAGRRTLSLGPRNLRADTAALVGLALALTPLP
ncbi:MAG: 16S rRNA (uracil(1498)-N(3))-methyltransferase [Candidatus Dormibacteraeota bacterium]|nr:16S rRNA (uracil(1498)-N(3))-methyltransferase [Candidatus Dormibacteraeota bacterium]